MLDTNICVYLIKRKPERLIKRITKHSPEDIVLSSITVSELYYGVQKSMNKKQNMEALNLFLEPFEILSYNNEAAKIYGKIRSDLERKGTPIGSMDLLIAAHALSLGLTLITNNTREFKRIRGLKVIDWTR
jgi:tRNA(fMet)-specific endonuclease VapC